MIRLRRYWITLLPDAPITSGFFSPLGYGVTAWTEDDALALLGAALFSGATPSGIVKIVADIDVSTLDAGHILPNIDPPNWRGVWYPQGLLQ